MKHLSMYVSLLMVGGILFSCTEEEITKYLGHVKNDQEMHYVTTLDGESEAPEPVHTAASGQLTLEVSDDGQEISFTLTVASLDNYLAGHLHVGADGEAGPVVAWLFPIKPYPFTDAVDDPLLPGTTNGVLAKGVITADNLTGPLAGMELSALLSELEDGNVYVNLHTSQFPAGEIRGDF